MNSGTPPLQSPPRRNVSTVLLCATLCLLGGTEFASANLWIYTDSLASGWYDTAASDAYYQNTSPVHSGSYSMMVNTQGYNSPWYVFNYDLIDTSGYSALDFWIYVGPTQSAVAVVPMASAQIQTWIMVGSLTPNVWQEITIPLSALGLENRSDFNGLWIQNDVSTPDPTARFYLDEIRLVAIPEPAGVSLLALGLAGVFLFRERCKC
jgi:alpha-L-arabinofuranosidase